MSFVRFIPLATSIAAPLLAIPGLSAVWAWTLLVVGTLLSWVAHYNPRQPHHSVRRNYPLVNRLQWFVEDSDRQYGASEPSRRKFDCNGNRERTPSKVGQDCAAFDRLPSSVAIDRPSDVKNTAVRPLAVPGYRDHERLEPVTVIGMADDGGFGFGRHGVA
ncbi:hypothetical protein [Sphingopyxis sp.]|uniref:hypothetical protein n=1 Tax=Sphingopyxis sp. TaxID=1908224 RepID=UPI002DF98BC7|nr:hypothetical protein [Sphingopyxis sp.]